MSLAAQLATYLSILTLSVSLILSNLGARQLEKRIAELEETVDLLLAAAASGG